MRAKKKILLSILLLVVLIGVFYLTTLGITKYTGRITGAVVYSPAEIENLAKCLASKEVKMYGSRTCHHCADQKALFGDSFKYINYIECLDNPDGCIDLSGVPAWEINGNIYYGTQSLDKLAELSGCKLK